MRVLRVLDEIRPSGVEAGLRATSSHWAASGVEIEVLATGRSLGPYAPVLAAEGYRLHHIPLEPVTGFLSAYLRLLAAGAFDLVHVHPERANFYVAGLARLVATRAVVRSVHNVFAFSGALRTQRWIQRALLRRLGVTHVSVSASVESHEWRHYRNPTIRIYNGYDETKFYPVNGEARAAARKHLGMEPKDFVVATVGNCSRVKNHGAVIEAAALLGEEKPVRFLHAGLEEHGEPERALAQRLGVLDRCVFLGQVQDVAGVLHAADAYVMPSLYEGLGNAALEALGCGVPSVLGDVTGLSDLREFFSQAVWWVAPESQAIAAALQEVAGGNVGKNPATRTRLAKIARQHFSSQRAVGEYLRLYNELLTQRPGTPMAARLFAGMGRQDECGTPPCHGKA